jgi:hypothetical protein
MGNMSTYVSQCVYFIGQYKEKTQVKISLNNSLIQGKRNEVWWANFPKVNEA